MDGVSPETCWTSYKWEIKFWYTVASCWILIHCRILLDFDTLSHLVGFWYTVASCWIFYVNYAVMHGSTNIKFTDLKISTSMTKPQTSWLSNMNCSQNILTYWRCHALLKYAGSFVNHYLWNCKCHYPVLNIPPIAPILSQMNPAYALPFYFFQILFNIILLCRPRAHELSPPKPTIISLLSLTCCMPRPSHSEQQCYTAKPVRLSPV